MSRLPAPEPGWEESTEGDLDADLTEEAGSRLEDWERPRRSVGTGAIRALSVLVIVTLVGIAIAQVLLPR